MAVFSLKIAPKHDTRNRYPPISTVTAEMGGFSMIQGTPVGDAGGCKDSPGCAPLAQSGASVRAVPPNRQTRQETVHPAGSQRSGAAYPGGTGRETPAAPHREKTGYGALTGACHFLFENDRRFSYFQEDLVECI